MRPDDRSSRLVRLLEYLNSRPGAVPVATLIELARREFGVSEVTLRSDLSALAALRGIRRAARGSYSASDEGSGQALVGGSLFATRLRHRAEAKIAIAGRVAELLAAQGELRVLLLDAGTTTFYLAERLSELSGLDLIVWTPSIAAAARLAGAQGVSVRLLGGEYQPEYAVVSGDETARSLRMLAGPEAERGPLDSPVEPFPGTHCVLDVNYLSPEGQFFTDESKERLQKRLMAELAEEVTIVADHTKLFGRRLGLQAHEVYDLAYLRNKRAVRLVTDPDADSEQRASLGTLMRRTLDREIRVEDGPAVLFEAG